MEKLEDREYETALILATMLVYKLRDPDPTHDTVTDAYDDFADLGWLAIYNHTNAATGETDDLQPEIQQLWDLAQTCLTEIDARECSARQVEAAHAQLAGWGD